MILSIGTAPLTVAMGLVTTVMVFLTYYFAFVSDDDSVSGRVSGSKFYVSSCWNEKYSRSTGNTLVPFVSMLLASLFTAKYLQLGALLPARSRLLLAAWCLAMTSCVFLIATCAITLNLFGEGGQATHLVLAFICFTSGYASMLCYHLVESRAGVHAQLTATYPHLIFRRVVYVIGFSAGCLFTTTSAFRGFPQRHVVGSVAELVVVSCIMATVTSFGLDLSNYKLDVSLSSK
jgi:hypothetical protein